LYLFSRREVVKHAKSIFFLDKAMIRSRARIIPPLPFIPHGIAVKALSSKHTYVLYLWNKPCPYGLGLDGAVVALTLPYHFLHHIK